MPDDIFRFGNLFFFAFVVGTYTFEWIVVTAALKGLPIERAAQFHDALFHHLPNRFMPWAGALGGTSAIILIILDNQSGTSEAFYVAGAVPALSSAVITFTLSRRIDLQIGALLPNPDPAEYGRLRRRWDRLISIRAPMGQIGFACYVLATLTV